MAKIPLRVYNREIETLIEQNQLEQAIAHARHILKFFPKHVHTYRQLGKAYLESQRYGDAADVFQRVLSSIPDDFISHVGMSIIREDEANLNHAIWHMERAFEVQPANGAIQSELRRLFGRRDGIEPPKIRLTRSALARMYIKGELYQQAIAEIRAALAEDPQRPDLLSLLAQAYFLNGQRVDAANTCSTLLKKTPYSLEANRILAHILGSTERAEEAQVYRQRIQALDPYYSHISPSAPTSDQVSEAAVTLEKMIWSPGQAVSGAPGQPEWAASMGVDIASSSPAQETLPEWLSEQPEPETKPESREEEGAALPEAPSPAPEVPLTEVPEDAIPEWMKEAGWQPAEGVVEEPVSLLDEAEIPPPASDELAPAHIPDWLQSLAPSEKPDSETSEEGSEAIPSVEEPVGESDALSWLEETPPGPTDTVAAWLEEHQPLVPGMPETDSEAAEETEIPAWLKGMEQAEPPTLSELAVPAPLAPPESQTQPEPVEPPPQPEWEAEIDITPPTAQADAEKIPDWLQELGEVPSAGGEIEPAEELPDWLRQTDEEEWQPIEPAETTSQETPSIPPAEVMPITSEEDELAWLDDLGDKQGVKEVRQLAPDEELFDEAPDWVLEAAPETPQEPAMAEEVPTGPLSEALSEITSLETEEPEIPSLVEPGGMPDWLREIAPEQEAEAIDQTETAMLFSPQEIAVEQEAGSPAEAILESEPETFAISDTQPTRIQLQPEESDLVTIEEAVPSSDTLEGDIPEWLRGLGEVEMAVEAVSELPAEEHPTEIIEQGIPFDEAIEPEATADETTLEKTPEIGVPLSDDEAFAWLESLAARQGAQEALLLEPEERLETPPEWVQQAAEVEQFAALPSEPGETVPSLEAVSEEEPLPEAQFGEAISPETIALESLPSMEEPLEDMPSPPEAAVEEPALESFEPTPPLETPPDLPGWLTDVEKAETPLAETGWVPPVEIPPEAAIEEAPSPTEQPAEIAPVWIDLNQAGLAELERLPGVGFTRAQAIIDYRQEHGPFTSVEDLINVSGFGGFLVDTLKDKIGVAEAEAAEAIPEVVGDTQVILIQARNALIQGNIPGALANYTSLIKKEQFLPEVIQDLNEALYRFPLDVSIWEALGEAHLRAGRLQEALDALTKAEELIR